MINVFAPPSENNSEAYIHGVEARVGTGPLDVTDPQVLLPVCLAIAHWESSRAVWSGPEVASGMLLADVRWPAFQAALGAPIGTTPAAPTVEASTADDLNAAELAKIQTA